MNKLVFTAISLLSFTTINAAEELPNHQSILHVIPITPSGYGAANNGKAFFPDGLIEFFPHGLIPITPSRYGAAKNKIAFIPDGLIRSRAANNEIAFFPDENSFESQGKNHPPHKSFVILSSSSANPKPTR